MSSIFSILFAILLFSVLIFAHELGHFAFAKLFGVQVNEFSMFMGPAIWQKQVGETMYSLRCIPIGGFCAMEGEDGDSDNPRAFSAAAWWKRLIILVAGASVNFVTGLVLFAIVFSTQKAFIQPVVAHVEQGSALAAQEGSPVGIREGDRFVKIDGERIYTYSDFSLIMDLKNDPVNNPENRHDVTILRDGMLQEWKAFSMQKRVFVDEYGTEALRFGFTFGSVETSAVELWKEVWNTAMSNVRAVRLSLQMLFTGKAHVQDVSGPVGIVQMMSETAAASDTAYYAFLNLLNFGGLIAVNLAVMNLLPIPALDGGRAVGVLLTGVIEAVTRKKLDPKYEGYIHGAGMILLLALMGLIMFKDIFTIVKG